MKAPDLGPIQAFLAPHHPGLVADLEKFVATRIVPLPHPETDDDAREQALSVVHRLGAEGWPGWAIPDPWGGHGPGTDLRACCLVREALAAASPLADAVFALQCLGSMPVVLAGSDRQRDQWLPAVVRGEAVAAFAMTEPEAGSDVAAIASVARPDGDGWRLDGRKSFISNAGIASFYSVFAKTDPDAGHRGLSCFLVPADTPGVSFAGPQILAAPHPLGEVVFEDCRLPSEALLGEAGQGIKIGLQALDRLRPTVAAAACGMAARALDLALDYARQRRQFGQALSEFQLIQQKLAVMATELTAARLLTYRAAAAADGGAERFTLESAMAKSYATEAAQRIVDQAIQVVGGRACLAEHTLDLFYRSVRALRIYEGTTEIQHLVIARHLLR